MSAGDHVTLPFGIGSLEWGDWLYGLASGIISGGATSVVTGFGAALSDPEHFSSGSHLVKLMTTVFVVSGVFNGLNFLRTKPMPDFKIVTTSKEKIVEVGGSPRTTLVTKVEETHQEPK